MLMQHLVSPVPMQVQFEELLAKFDKEKKGGLYWRDITRMIFHNFDVRSLSHAELLATGVHRPALRFVKGT